MADTTLLDTRWTKVDSFNAFPESPSVYVTSKTAAGGTKSVAIMSLDEMQEVLDEAIKQGWKRA